MKKRAVVVLFCLVVLLAGCGSNDTSALEKRLDALEKENARMAEQLDSIAKQLGVHEQSNVAIESQTSSLPQTTQIVTEVSTEQEIQSGFIRETASGLDQTYYVYMSDRGSLRFRVERSWDKIWDVVESGERLVLEAKTEWYDIILIYEIDPSIASGPECEKKIRAITKSFESEGVSDDYAPYFVQDMDYHLNGQGEVKSKSGGKINYDDTWWIGIIDNRGAYYCREKSTRFDKERVDFSSLEYEAYMCTPNSELGAWHITCEILSYDFQSYYDSLETTIEKNNAKGMQVPGLVWYTDEGSSGQSIPLSGLLKPNHTTIVTVGKR